MFSQGTWVIEIQGHAHVLGINDLDDLLALNGPEVAAGGKPGSHAA